MTSEGLCYYADYGVIEGTQKGETYICGPLLIETVQPPPTTTQYIQLHRLSGKENLSHLLLVYHHYSAAKAVIFINTSDEFQLSQNLLDTLPVSSKEYSKIFCFVITKSAGADLVELYSLFQPVQCRINFFSTDTERLIRPPEEVPRAIYYSSQGTAWCYRVAN